MITAKKLKTILQYDSLTGRWTWLVKQSRKTIVGKRAGTIRKDGRCQICIEGKLYLGSRLAVLYMTGKLPKNLVDHKNTDSSDERWKNLREATYSQNMANQNVKNPNGYRGITRSTTSNAWQSQISVNKKNIFLGNFKTKKAAAFAYETAAHKYFGEFSRKES